MNTPCVNPPRRTRLFAIAIWGLLWLALTIQFFNPTRTVFDASLDYSNYGSYTYFTANGFNYGSEVVPMAGPFGFVLYGFVFSGDLFFARVFWQLLLTGSLAALTIWFFRGSAGAWSRWVWLVLHLAFLPRVDDAQIEWTLLLGGLLLLHSRSLVATAATGALLGWITLFKGTHLILAPVTLTVALAVLLVHREHRRAGIAAGAYVGSLLLAWLGSGQLLADLPSFVEGVRQLAAGYNAAMSLPTPTDLLVRGIVTFTLLAAGLGWAAWLHRRNLTALAGLMLFAGFVFVKWKHGYVRADGHVWIFFLFVAAAAPAIHAFTFGWHTAAGGWRRHVFTLLSFSGLIAALYGPTASFPTPVQWWNDVRNQTHRNLTILTSLQDQHAMFSAELDRRRRLYDLPLVREAIGNRSIDFIGHEQGVLMLNRFNYQPRPMGGGSFNVYNPYLIELNGAHLRDPARRPDFFLVKAQSIDLRLMSADDSQTLHEVLFHYRPRLVDNGYLLMEKIGIDRPTPTPRLLERRSYRFGDHLPVPKVGPDELLLVRLDFPPSLLGRLLGAVYQAPHVFIQLFGPELSPDRRRLLPGTASHPFIVSPVLEDTGDFLELYTDRTSKTFDRLRITTTDRAGYARDLTIEFYTLPRPTPISAEKIDDLTGLVRVSIPALGDNHAPEGADRSIYPFHAMLVHPPLEKRWELDGTKTQVEIGFGVVSGAYNGGQTDGMVFIAELRRPSEPPEILFQRFLDPLNKPAEQGHHSTTVTLPPHPPGTRFVLRTEAGPAQNDQWDWAYFSHLRFR